MSENIPSPGGGRRAVVLLNPRARQGTDGVDAQLARLEGDGFRLTRETVTDPDGIPERIRRHQGQVDLVIVGGGDGTMSAALPGLLEAGLPLGILPLGTANNLARTLGIPAKLDEACAVIAAGHTRRIDVGRVNDRAFLTTASMGLSVRITGELTGDAKKRWGPFAYVVTALRSLRNPPDLHAEITYEGKVLAGKAVQIVVGNGRYYGSGLAVAEDAQIDDGRLDVYVIRPQPRWRMILLAPALKQGRQGRKRDVLALSAKEVRITTREPQEIDVDGEIGAATPAAFSVMERALEVFAPAGGNGDRG
jgi:YegS/Rv2252/BmrU family lipid kinase